MSEDMHWSTRAACRRTPEIMWPTMTLSRTENRVLVARAKAVCERCPVTAPCLEAGLAQDVQPGSGSVYGIYGGMTGAEREALRRSRRAVS